MRERTTSRLAWLTFGLITALFVAGFALSSLNQAAESGGTGAVSFGDILFLAFFSFPLVGVLIASRQPRNTIGLILLAIGLAWGILAVVEGYAYYGLVTNPGSVPAPDVAAALASPGIPPVGLMGTFLILLFPDGRLPSRRWKPLAWLSAIALTLPYLVIVFTPGLVRLGIEQLPVVAANPLGIESLRPILELMGFLILLIPICILCSAASMVMRFRRSRGMERLQLKWLTYAVAAVVTLYLIGWLLPGDALWVRVVQYIVAFSYALIPVAMGIAILRHRLFDIDVVIKKTVVFGALAAFITVVYVAIVVGIGNLIGSSDEPNLGLSVVATAVVAVAFQPVRERLQHFANRLVYGRRATPYEVLSEFSDQVAETYSTEDVLPRMARTIKEGVAAEHAEVRLRTGAQLRPAASHPPDGTPTRRPIAVSDEQLPPLEGADRAIEVRHQGQLLGALTVTKPPAEPLSPAEGKLLADLASQAGLVLRNVGLTAELLARLDELQESRKRLATAQDQERRRIERDLHDGAQQYLVALKTRLGLAKRIGEQDPTQAVGLMSGLEELAGETLDTLRDLARGIYPPLLADQGLKAALEAQARKATIPIEITDEGVSRYSQEIESAAYFCCLEALQNAAKYAQASRVVVRLAEDDGTLVFSVQDDGQGFDPTTTLRGAGMQNMSDRLEALGGTLTVRSSLGQGTTVAGEIPLSPVSQAVKGAPAPG